MMTCLRDWWRGYSDADIRRVEIKLSRMPGPGGYIPLSGRELKALCKNTRLTAISEEVWNGRLGTDLGLTRNRV